ncbi:MAG: hypothetical protein JWO57_1696 [Pseudonocardiales bacterium]|nr:hypothetical protein [Pseudonocardiales bacterium]
MATHYENAADHIAAAMTSEPGSIDDVFHTVAAQTFAAAAEGARTTDEINAANERFRALRASGFTGPIDQDGYPVTDGHPLKPLLDAIRRGDA